jgi:hypothetical protein
MILFQTLIFVLNYQDFLSRGVEVNAFIISKWQWWGCREDKKLVFIRNGILNVVGKEFSNVPPVPLWSENRLKGEEGILFAPKATVQHAEFDFFV